MAYRVTAGRVSAETTVNADGGRAVIDHPRGSVLPDDVPDEQLQHLLRLGHIEPDGEVEGDPEESDEPVDLSEMDKDQLAAFADEHEIAVDKRLGVDNFRAAIVAALDDAE